jgi:phosphoglycolate phosphatase
VTGRESKMGEKKLAVFFPGIGYHCDKPLLYYAAKLAKTEKYEVLPVPYTGFPEKVRGNMDKMRVCLEIAWSQANELLMSVDFSAYNNILFIGKSIGTIVGSAYAKENGLDVHSILLTPLADTFRYVCGNAIAFHGTADPWAETGVIREACRKRGIPLYLTEGANHSLETGDVEFDIEIIQKTMKIIQEYALGRIVLYQRGELW